MGTAETTPEIRLEDLRFDPPGPGSWTIDRTHVTRPFTRWEVEIFPEPFAEGFREAMSRYGVLIDGPRYVPVHGFVYSQPLPAPEQEIPERFAAAEKAFETRLWREDVRRWDEEAKPASITAHLELQAVDPAALDDEALLEHIGRARENQRRMIVQHHRFNGAALVPTGDFLVQASQMTGASPAELLALLRGTAPVSGAEADGLARLAQAIRDDAEARSLLDSGGDPGELLDGLRSRPGEVGEAASQYVERVGYRLLDGLDIGFPYALEKPEVLVTTIRNAVVGRSEASELDVEALEAGLRARVPEHQRAAFDELLAEARHSYRLRDERGIYSDIWAMGIVRRAILEAGRRLAGAGRVDDPEHMIEAGWDEIQALVRGEGGPDGAELAARARFRMRYSTMDAPDYLGDPPSPPPSTDGLPPAAARVMNAVGFSLNLLFADSEAESEERLVRGFGTSPGVYEGTARVLAGPEQLERLEQGDVLVTQSTSEAFNIALPLVGAIVTDAGGLLSHAAIVSREYGVPGVVGTRDATRLIPDGARVRVDGEAGEVAVLG